MMICENTVQFASSTPKIAIETEIQGDPGLFLNLLFKQHQKMYKERKRDWLLLTNHLAEDPAKYFNGKIVYFTK